MVSSVHNVCKKGYYIAILSTNVETDNPEAELKPAFDIIGAVKEKFVTVSEMYEPTSNGNDGLYISNSMDPTSHFENETLTVLKMYK